MHLFFNKAINLYKMCCYLRNILFNFYSLVSFIDKFSNMFFYSNIIYISENVDLLCAIVKMSYLRLCSVRFSHQLQSIIPETANSLIRTVTGKPNLNDEIANTCTLLGLGYRRFTGMGEFNAKFRQIILIRKLSIEQCLLPRNGYFFIHDLL